MRHSGALRRHQLVIPGRARKALTKIARWTMYASCALAVSFGLLVWPANVRAVGGIHGLAGWFVIASLGTFALSLFLLKRVRSAAASCASESAAATAMAIKDAAAEFLAKKRVAVTGVSRKPESHGSNVVYRWLRERGYQVFAINPNTSEVEGDRCFPDLKSIPGGVEAVLIGTRPDRALATMRECADLGIKQVWMHRSVGVGSVSEEAAAWGRQHGLRVIAGGCPLMFDPAADTGHKIMLPLFTLTGKVPRRV